MSLRPPTRPLHGCRGCHGCHMFVTWVVPVSGWLPTPYNNLYIPSIPSCMVKQRN